MIDNIIKATLVVANVLSLAALVAFLVFVVACFWSVHWAVGAAAIVVLLLIAMPEGTVEKNGDHTQW